MSDCQTIPILPDPSCATEGSMSSTGLEGMSTGSWLSRRSLTLPIGVDHDLPPSRLYLRKMSYSGTVALTVESNVEFRSDAHVIAIAPFLTITIEGYSSSCGEKVNSVSFPIVDELIVL